MWQLAPCSGRACRALGVIVEHAWSRVPDNNGKHGKIGVEFSHKDPNVECSMPVLWGNKLGDVRLGSEMSSKPPKEPFSKFQSSDTALSPL